MRNHDTGGWNSAHHIVSVDPVYVVRIDLWSQAEGSSRNKVWKEIADELYLLAYLDRIPEITRVKERIHQPEDTYYD